MKSDSPHADERQEFCLALKAARERKGISLAQISAATKIPASVFAALERNDVSRWPKGLFRRSFFRDYVRTIDVPVPETCAEFVRLFPDGEVAEPTAPAPAVSEPTQQDSGRLMLDAAWQGPGTSVVSRLVAALIDAGLVVGIGITLAWVTDANGWTAIGVVALTYFSVATAWLGESPAKWTMSRVGPILVAMAHGASAGASPWTRGAEAITDMFKSADDEAQAPETAEEAEAREWISDARRVGPAPSSRLRVRIKASQ